MLMRVIFQEVVRVSLSDQSDHSSAEKDSVPLTLRIDERQNRSEKEFTFILSREEDPRFIYSLSLRRSNYDSLKREQDLLCDFDSFPKMIADFVGDLQRAPNAYLKGRISDDKSQFRFELIGKMDFKWVSVVSLCLHALTDSALVAHLVDKILLLKRQLEDADNVRDNLLAAQAEIRELKEAALRAAGEQAESLARLEAEKTEVISRQKELKEKFEEEIDELKADKEMLSTEVSMLRQEVIDFRTRVDGLVEEVASLKDRERFLNETLDSTEDRLEISERRASELMVILKERDEEIEARTCEIEELRGALDESKAANVSLRIKLREMKSDRDHWKAENEKGVKIINKLLKEQKEKRLRSDDEENSSQAERIRQLEADLEERKQAVEALSDSNSQLRVQMENLMSECAKMKKDAEEWAIKCDKKERMLADLLKLRHASPIGQTITSTAAASAPPVSTVYPRVLGWSSMTGQLSTPLRTSPYAYGTPHLYKQSASSMSTPTTSQIAPTQPNQS
uniref:Spindle assembly abnormal protein 6 N-terminal domain-containing protein n=1 Tax=Parascaris univalens TaxID=6257 RepID=A0A915ASM3_PARUN